MSEKKYYILTIEAMDQVEKAGLQKKLNLALDWAQIMPNVFILESTSSPEKWYTRLKAILGDTSFFLATTILDENTGWLSKWVWKWIEEKEK